MSGTSSCPGGEGGQGGRRFGFLAMPACHGAQARGPPARPPARCVAGSTAGDIDVFCRVVTHRNKEGDHSLPYLLFLQGGPGFEAPRPLESCGWIKHATNYFRVVLMVSGGGDPPSVSTPGKGENRVKGGWGGKAGEGFRTGAAFLSCLEVERQKRSSEGTQAGGGVCARRGTGAAASDWSGPGCRPQDQRGTGLSTAVTADNIVQHGSPEEQASYLSFFRCSLGRAGRGAGRLCRRVPCAARNLLLAAWMLCRSDSIVADAEIIRSVLVPSTNHDGRWTILGQSFGGFCCVSYLSVAPESASVGRVPKALLLPAQEAACIGHRAGPPGTFSTRPGQVTVVPALLPPELGPSLLPTSHPPALPPPHPSSPGPASPPPPHSPTPPLPPNPQA